MFKSTFTQITFHSLVRHFRNKMNDKLWCNIENDLMVSEKISPVILLDIDNLNKLEQMWKFIFENSIEPTMHSETP